MYVLLEVSTGRCYAAWKSTFLYLSIIVRMQWICFF